MRQGGIDVISTQQNVIAYRDALERDLSALVFDRNQCKIGSPAADIDHQDQVADTHQLAPVRITLNPSVECGLRLFEQGDIGVTGLLGRLQSQIASHGVEGRGHRDQT